MPADRNGRWPIEDILARVDLPALLDELAVPATSVVRGRRWHCPVPGHDDRHASVTTHTDARGHQRWRCWAGDDRHRGDAIDLLQITRGLNRAQAIEQLATRAGLTNHTPPPPNRPPPRPPQPPPGPIPLDPSVVQYVHACHNILNSRAGRPVRDWLHQRGFTDELIAANHLGADPGRKHLYRRNGMPYGHGPAATFPALDPNGTIRYVQTRYLQPPVGGPKYDNPNTKLGTNPRLAWTNTPTPAEGVLIVCEGIPDALTAAQAGHRAVAVLGSQAPDQTVANRLIVQAEHHNLTIIAIQDNDPAGRRWADRLGDLLADRNHNLHIIEPPTPGTDLNDWAQQDPQWHQWLTHAHDQTLPAPTTQPLPPPGQYRSPPSPGLEIV